MTIETLIFDFDGTCADTEGEILEIAKIVTKKYKIKMPNKEEIQKLKNLHAEEVKDHLFGKGSWGWIRAALTLPPMLYEGKNMFQRMESSIKPHYGMVEVINKLSKNKEILSLTSNRKATVLSIFKRWGLRCNEVYHTGIFGKAGELEKMAIEREWIYDNWKKLYTSILYFGDEARDVEACKQMHIPVIGVTWGLNSKQALLNAGLHETHTVNYPSQIPEKIKYIEAELSK